MIDLAHIKVRAGKGGDGLVHFRREKFVPKGGPDGGDGGKGGSVYFVADNNLATLMDFRSKLLHKAEDGGAGGEKNMIGADGEDIRIRVPLGTLVYEIEGSRETLVADLVTQGQEFLTARGGRGGRGNVRFKSSTNVKPMQYTKGMPGEEKEIKLEVRLVADVGLIGLPNAGKSTLINKLTNANAKVGAYPFTTINPNLGTCNLKNGRSIIISDVPGLIEGASEGKGLGDEFLRHVQRTRMLVHIIDPLPSETVDKLTPDVLAKTAWDSYVTIRKELEAYTVDLTVKEEVVAINKLDITEVEESFEEIKQVFSSHGVSVVGISAVSGKGTEVLLNVILKTLAKTPEKYEFEVSEAVKVYTIDNLPNRRMVFGNNKVLTKDVSEA